MLNKTDGLTQRCTRLARHFEDSFARESDADSRKAVKERYDFERLRNWLPVPVTGIGFEPIRWILLDGNRHAVSAILCVFVFVSLFTLGTLWTWQVEELLNETSAVQTLLNTLLSGIILLVSIVSSINSVVLSHDITPLGSQRDRIEDAMSFREDLEQLTSVGRSPTDPAEFLDAMVDVIRQRAADLQESVQAESDLECGPEIEEFTEAIDQDLKGFDEVLDQTNATVFSTLWLGMEYDYGVHMDRSRHLRTTYDDDLPEPVQERFEALGQSFEMFSVGKEYFKTLYYNHEFSQLSRTLLIVSLPTILITASTILAVDAKLFPDIWLLGLPPLLTFLAAMFTVSLIPYVVLTAYILRSATVAYKTVAAGPFVLKPK